ncbi:MAG: polyketide synthase dehydratase domain-containing protein [Proteobacteria bacterium]|nr:polyketide synthase dehydratase domain-containing protein [Pseudomonadota bacterium]
MERAGIDMLQPEAGIGVVRRELQAQSAGAVEVLVAGRLGLLLDEWDATGGLDPAAVPVGTAGPMVTRATAMTLHGGLSVEVTLDPSEQPFLFDHRIDGTALLPGVMGIEAFAEAARWALPEWQVAAVEDVDFSSPFKFYRGEPRTVTLDAQLQRDGEYVVAHCRLIGVRQLSGQSAPQASTHFSARVRLARHHGSALKAERPRLSDLPRVIAADIYRVYFHGPAYQVLEAAWRDGEVVYGLLPAQLPLHHRPETLPTTMARRLIELCFQTAGVYEIGVLGRMGLPAHVDRVEALRDPATAEGRLYAVVRPSTTGVAALGAPSFDAPSFDAYVTDEAGNVFVTLRGYRTVALPDGVADSARAPLRSAMC